MASLKLVVVFIFALFPRTTHALFFGSSQNNTIGERCNERHVCADDLTCLPTPFRNRCFPFDCLAAAVAAFTEEVNMTEYQQTIFEKAGVTQEEFFLQGEFWSQRTNHSISSRLGGAMTAYQYGQEMKSSPYVHRVMQTIRENPIPQDSWTLYQTAISQCDPEYLLSSSQYGLVNVLLGLGRADTHPAGILGTAGFGAKAGAGLGGGVTFFFAFPSYTTEPLFFINVGGGLVLGADVGVSGMVGMHFSGNASNIEGFGFQLEVEIPIPFVSPGVAVGVDLNPFWDLSFFLDLGVGFGVGGFSAGYTWGFP